LQRQHGFTLVEIMIVVFVIGLLAAIAIPNLVKAREVTRRNICISNLWAIEAAKEQWALMSNKDSAMDKKNDKKNKNKGKGRGRGGNTGDPVDEDEVNELLKDGAPDCPADGEYTYGVLGENPKCSLGKKKGHVLQ